MKTSSYYISQLTDLTDDMASTTMKLLMDKGFSSGVGVKTDKGYFEISIAKDSKTKRTILKINYPEKNLIFSQQTINPFVLADILEQVEKS